MFFSTTAAVAHLAVGMAAFPVQALVVGLYAHTALVGVVLSVVPSKTYKTLFTTAADAADVAVGRDVPVVHALVIGL
jgi:hypothetical protein